MSEIAKNGAAWPSLAWDEWAETADTLHMWTQIVGKTRLALTPLENHWWNVPLYVTARGLGTSAMPYNDDVLDIEFDFVAHRLRFRLGSGQDLLMPLRVQTVADFYKEYLGCLASLGVQVKIDPMPCELASPIRFDLDTVHKTYDAASAERFWRVLVHAEKIFKEWGTGFLGKVSPVHFFWGSFDMAVTRFSGRPAPPRPGADSIQREAHQRGILAGKWRLWRGGVLLLRGSGAGGASRGEDSPGSGGMGPKSGRVPLQVRCAASRGFAGCGADGVFRKRVCGGGGRGQMGSGGAGTAVGTGLSAPCWRVVSGGLRYVRQS